MHPYKRLIAVILFLALLWAAFEVSGLRGHFSLTYLQQQIQQNRITGLLIFVALFCLANLVQIPGWIFLVAAVLTMGKLWGGLATYVAACMSCAVTFLLIRLAGGDVLRQINNKVAIRILGQLDARPVRSVILLRVLFQTLPALNYALAMSGIQFRQYMTGTLLGMPWPIAFYCVFFEYLAKALNIL